MRLIAWIKNHKLITILLLIIFYFLYQSFGSSLRPFPMMSAPAPTISESQGIGGMPAPAFEKRINYDFPPVGGDYTPQPGIKDRLVIQESHISLQVTDVVNTRKQIISYATQAGGYMVTSSVESPQETPTSTVTVRIPSSKLEEALEYFRSLSVKVVSENLVGEDVTDQYVDIEKRIAIFEKTKAKFEEILASAREVSDIVNLNQQIISIQSQIDDLKGQQEALTKNAQLAKLTIYLSTDDMSLPYAPKDTFRPGVIFKLAVRSLVGSLRVIVTLAIWLGVYAVIWVPVLILVLLLKKRLQK